MRREITQSLAFTAFKLVDVFDHDEQSWVSAQVSFFNASEERKSNTF